MILTSTGEHFYFDGPHRFDVRDIAAALAKLCRFTGHVREFYSVAQHCVHASEIVEPEFALEALLHDAQEAYLGDVSAPLKRRLVDYQTLELRVELSLRERFGLPFLKSPEVKHADLVMLATEKRDLMPVRRDAWAWPVLRGIVPLERTLNAWPWQEAERAFLHRYRELVAL